MLSPILSPSPQSSVEQAAAALTSMLAGRATERLQQHKSAAEPLKAVKPRPPGVYFGLPSADYHADPSLGSTDLKTLLIHPACYWQRSQLNPDSIDDSDSPAKKIGRALHTLVLEGEAAFAKQFAAEPSPEAYPGALVSLEDLKGATPGAGRTGVRHQGGVGQAHQGKGRSHHHLR